MADEFFSFEEALSELRLKEEELKRLVSEGEIRAFREGDTMKLRRGDVEALRDELSGGEVVDLGGGDDELVFEDDLDLSSEAGMATEEISDVDTIIEDDVEDIGELELDDEEDLAPAASMGGGGVRRTAPRATLAQTEEEGSEGMGLRAALIVTTLVLVLGLPVALSVSSGVASDLAMSIAGIFGGGK